MRGDLLKGWGLLLALQAAAAFLVLRDFLIGDRYFAYLDIGADTYALFSAYAMMMARMLAAGEGWSGWSFQIGLGAPTGMLTDAFSLLTQLGGPERVLDLRIWVYLLKLALGGAFFLMLALHWVKSRTAAVLVALSYTFCGYAVSNGQWDGEATWFAALPLLLWAVSHHLRTGSMLCVPLAVAAALLAGSFFLMVGVSLLLACAIFVALSDKPRAMLGAWLTRVFPLVVVGYLIAAPATVPYAVQLLDSARASGPTSAIGEFASQAFGINSVRLLLVQIGGLFHKNLFGVGNSHFGYMNYLEGPDFYVGLLPLLIIPQLWRSSVLDRRVLVVGLAGIAAYFVFPVFRLAAFGFAGPYFRGTTLWVTLALALLTLRAIDRVIDKGVDARLLAVGAASFSLLLSLVIWGSDGLVWIPHALQIAVMAGGAAILLWLCACFWSRERFAALLLALIGADLLLIARPSFYSERRFVSQSAQPFNDRTLPALAAIQQHDKSVFRVEKLYTSAHLSDAMAQNYMGVKSYYHHGKSIVDFHAAMDLMVQYPAGRPLNWSNWLPDPGDRYLLHSLLGVKYLIASGPPPEWPGFRRLLAGSGYAVYQNEFALPLGVVQSAQVTRAQLAALSSLPEARSRQIKDAALINAVVLDQLLPDWGRPLDLDALARQWPLDIAATYTEPALALQRAGLQIANFSSNYVSGRIRPADRGILVFSIPFHEGWRLRIDGRPAPLFKANFGMLAAPVGAGPHEVELMYERPGGSIGFFLGLVGIALLALAGWVGRRRL